MNNTLKSLIVAVALFILSINGKAQNAPYPNLSFEAYNFNNWTCFKGTATSNGTINTDYISIFATPLTGPLTNYQTIYPHPPPCLLILGCNNNATDFCGGFSKKCPFPGAGAYSANLNDENSDGTGAGLETQSPFSYNSDNNMLLMIRKRDICVEVHSAGKEHLLKLLQNKFN